MKCSELMAALNDYVDGAIDPGVCEEFEQHLAGCNPCQIVVDNIRQTIAMYCNGEPVPLPPELQARLCDVLRARWREKYPEASV